MSEKILTQQELQAIRERAAATTPGPWVACNAGKCQCKEVWSEPVDSPVAKVESGEWGDTYPEILMVDGVPRAYMKRLAYGEIPQDAAVANAAFIAHSREDVDRLLATVKRYKEALEFYGDVFNWGHPLTDGRQAILAGCFLPGDNGQRARQVLAITADKRQE